MMRLLRRTLFVETAGHAEGGDRVERDHVHERHDAIAIDVQVRVPLAEVAEQVPRVGVVRVGHHVGRDVLCGHLCQTTERGQRRDALKARETGVWHGENKGVTQSGGCGSKAKKR